MEALAGIRMMDRWEIAGLLPLPDRQMWKFGALIPDKLFRMMATADYYRLDAFLQGFAGTTMHSKILNEEKNPAAINRLQGSWWRT